MLTDYQNFIKQLLSELSDLGIDPDSLTIDHLGYQADSADDYNKRTLSLSNKATLLSESIVGGRRVGIYQLHEPLTYDKNQIDVVEVVEPKEGQKAPSSWEHIEFIVSNTLESFIDQYPNIEWETSAINREEFPMLILKLGNGMQAKFPRLGVKNELNRQRQK